MRRPRGRLIDFDAAWWDLVERGRTPATLYEAFVEGWNAADRPAPQWLLDLVRDFSPKVVPLDVDENGGYQEATTRWGLHPSYAAVPQAIREQAGNEPPSGFERPLGRWHS